MKKLLITALAISFMMLMPASAFAAEPTTAAAFVCPNRNEVCTNNGACINDGQCINKENCLNDDIPKQNGTGHHRGGQGRGHHNRNRCH